MSVLRLYDPRTGDLRDIPSGPLRVHVYGPRLRVHVVADVLRRAAQRRGRQVLIGHSGPPPDRVLAEANIQPMEWDGPAADADLSVSDISVPGHCLIVPPANGPWPDADPICVRLAMLRTAYRDPLHLAPADLSQAEGHLGAWRRLVAEWANAPGKPMSAPYVATVFAALDDDLDTPSALSALDRLAADPKIPPGSKLETFIHVDLILALDLVREIGRPG